MVAENAKSLMTYLRQTNNFAKKKKMKAEVSIIMGSKADMPVMKKAAELLNQMEIPFEINALSAHRTPNLVESFATNAKKNGIKVIIAGAGGAAHLPGVVAAFTSVPVIGVPCRSSISIDGWDSILSILSTLFLNFRPVSYTHLTLPTNREV